MNTFRVSQAVRSQRGVGLVEVMISLVIGLVLLGALAYFFLGSQQMNRTHDDVSRMQESGRNAMEILGRAIRQAGYQLDVDQGLSGDAIAGTDYGGTGASAKADTITIRHDPAWVSDTAVPKNPYKGQEANCASVIMTSNNDVNATTGNRAVNTNLVEYGFSVAGGNLLCSAAAANPASGGVVVADNIENMQITYGIGNGSEAITVYTATPTVAQFRQVSAVRVSLLVKGPTANLAVNKSQTFTYNGASVTTTDGFLRQVYTSTFSVRNQARWK